MLRSGLFIAALFCAHAFCGQPAESTPARSEAEVKALIQKLGATAPEWLASTPLNYPKTLDLTFNVPPKVPWNANKWISQYFWSVVNENPSKWKEGIKLLHHALTVNKDSPDSLQKTMKCLAGHYHNLLGDYARAAFWFEKSGISPHEHEGALANCYLKLGSKDACRKLLEQIGDDNTRHCSIVKLWSDMGEPETAIKLAEKAAANEPDQGFLAAGDVCRKYKKFPEALAFYEKVVAAPVSTARKEDFNRAKKQAQENIDAIKVIELLDLGKIKDGNYVADSESYKGRLEVTVTVKGGKIADCRVTRQTDQQFYNSIYVVPAQIIEKQGVKGVDSYSSATITSTAIINSTTKALSNAMKSAGPTAGK